MDSFILRRFARLAALAALCVVGDPRISVAQEPEPPKPDWQFGSFFDAGYSKDFNSPSNHLFRNRGTTPRVDEPDLNMAAAYVRKNASAASRWGVELTGHGGQDSQTFGFSATAPNIGGADWLRYLGPSNVSYLAPVGSGLTVQTGIFNSFIGYDALYARDNFNYTRPWGADYTPYLMLGVNASYAVNKDLTATLLVLNGYWHLAHANNVPSAGGQLAYKATDRVTMKQTVLYGPHQTNTSLDFWRFLSDSIVERKAERVTTAFELQFSTEGVDVARHPRAVWMAAQLPVHWSIRGPWSLTVRPEFCWDSDGRWTGFEQSVRAMTTTLEYRVPLQKSQTILRIEHRYDDSRGQGGGFFNGREVEPGVVGLTPAQHLLVLGLIVTFDASSRQ